MIKAETKIFSCIVEGNGLDTMTKQINDYLENNVNTEISFHNITSNNHAYVIATVKLFTEVEEGPIIFQAKTRDKEQKT
jgi:uncharacterized protein YpmS